jgi:hypothetical protein
MPRNERLQRVDRLPDNDRSERLDQRRDFIRNLLFVASRLIDDKHEALGGDAGLLGPPIENVGECPDHQGFFRRYRNGMIYFNPQSGTHEVHGAILDKWASLGFERSFLGYPVTDETGTPDGVGRFNRFQNGMIYWTPGTQAHEIHGDILSRWSDLGFERSYLGYPISDEVEYGDPDGGRASFFERGGIYWWPDIGPVDLRDVVVHYTGLVCFKETVSDQLSNSDEPYAVIGVTSPDGSASFRSRIYDDVDSGESRPDLMEVYRGKPKGLALSVLLMEHDDDDPDKYKAAMQVGVGAAATGVTALIAMIPVAGPVLATGAGALLATVVPKVSQSLSDLLDLQDDKLGQTTLAVSAKQMVVLAARTVNSTTGGVGFKLQTAELTGGGSRYKVYFGVVPA